MSELAGDGSFGICNVWIDPELGITEGNADQAILVLKKHSASLVGFFFLQNSRLSRKKLYLCNIQ